MSFTAYRKHHWLARLEVLEVLARDAIEREKTGEDTKALQEVIKQKLAEIRMEREALT
jgi:hypothetical protein